MKLSQTTFHWEALGERDAYGAILTERSAEDGPWTPEAFLRTGREEVERIRTRAVALGLPFGGARALDFGCGVGRLTRPLLAHFARVDGVDAARSMLRRARRLHADAPGDRLRWISNRRPDLRRLEDGAYDLVLSLITLQHVPPACAARYVAAFFTKARQGATVFFQLPARSHPRSARLLRDASLKQRALWLLPTGLLERYRLLRTAHPRMDMFGMPRAEVEALVARAGGELVAADDVADAGGLLPSFRYFARRARA